MFLVCHLSIFPVRALTSALALAVSSLASAQTTHHASVVRFVGDGWNYVPVMSQSGAQLTTESFLAVDEKAQTAGNKIVSIWYIRDTTAPDGWSAKAWYSGDPWAAVQSIKQSRSIADDEDHRWGVPRTNPGSTASATPANFTNGVFADDQFAALTSDDALHDDVVALLTEIDYKAADVPLERAASSGCSTGVKLSVLAASAETAAALGANAEPPAITLIAAQSVAAFATSAGCAGIIVVPTVRIPIGPAGPWIVTSPRCKYDGLTGITTCYPTRTQPFKLGRTCTITAASGVSFCTQYGTGTCDEPASGPSCSTPLATCTPGMPTIPTPPGNVPIDRDLIPVDGIPDNCSGVSWTTANPPGCSCGS